MLIRPLVNAIYLMPPYCTSAEDVAATHSVIDELTSTRLVVFRSGPGLLLPVLLGQHPFVNVYFLDGVTFHEPRHPTYERLMKVVNSHVTLMEV